MNKIYKYLLSDDTMQLPKGFQILKCAVQHERLHFWAIVNEKAPSVTVQIKIIGTGGYSPGDEWQFIDTIFDGDFVWHVFVKEL